MVNATVTCDPAGPEFTLIWRTSHSPWPGSYGHRRIRAVVLGRWLPDVLRGRPELAGPGSLTWQISSRLVTLMRRRPVLPPVFDRIGGQLMHREHRADARCSESGGESPWAWRRRARVAISILPWGERAF